MHTPNFRSSSFLHAHAKAILAFYEPVARDPKGGFFHAFRDDGSVYDPHTRHLVSSCRFVFNYANAFRLGYGDHYRDWALHALRFVRKHHRPEGHYAWVINSDGETIDARAMAYGQAFVMLAGASAWQAGVEEGSKYVETAWEVLETHFWQEKYNAYADELDDSLSRLDPYRGQNANMHACEAMLSAFQASGEQRFLQRALLLAQGFTCQLASSTGGQIWEHYTQDWQADWEYNKDKPDDLFKPWGFQPGHQVEWAKLLLQLAEHQPQNWMLPAAQRLFHAAWKQGWDNDYGGLVYGYAPDGSFSNSDKYFWVMAEAIAAAWRLWRVTGEQDYLEKYQLAWDYAWNHLIDHKYGAWFRIRNRNGTAIDNMKSPPSKVDYHTLGGCWDCLAAGGQE